jgi:CBS domain containing-hemolysin-like protein
MVELIVAVSFAVVISGMCSLFEAVLYSVPISHVESLAEDGHRSGKILRSLRRDVDRPIAAILSLNTIANTAGAAVAGAAAANVYGEAWVGWFSAFFTLAILIFSEVIPKTAGVVYSRPLSRVIAGPLNILVFVFRPFIWLTSLFTRMMAPGHEQNVVSQEELVIMTRLGMQTGTIEADEAKVIQNILSLRSKSVRDIMTPRTVMLCLGGRLSADEVREKVGVLAYSRVPVYDKDAEDIVGVLLRRDLLTAIAEDRGRVQLDQIMRPVDFVAESLSLNRLLRMFMERREHLLMVVDEFGELAGLVTLEDVLEEILGQEIVDEFDTVTDLRELARDRRERTLGQQPSRR